MPALELKHLRTLLALKQKGSLVEAAEQVHLTQSALSHQIKDLEDKLGCALLIRKSRPLQFTPAGEKLLGLAYTVLPEVSAVEDELRDLAGGDAGRLHIVIECHSCFEWLLPTLNTFRQRWPSVDMDLGTGFSFNGLHALSRGQIDCVITSDPNDDPDIAFVPLFQFQMLLAHSKQHWLTNHERVKPQDLADETLIIYPVNPDRLSIFSQFLTPAGVKPATTRVTELTLMMIQLVSSDLGVCVLPSWALTEYLQKDFVAAKPLGDSGLWCTLYAAIQNQHAELSFMQDFIQLARTLPFQHLIGIQAP